MINKIFNTVENRQEILDREVRRSNVKTIMVLLLLLAFIFGAWYHTITNETTFIETFPNGDVVDHTYTHSKIDVYKNCIVSQGEIVFCTKHKLTIQNTK